METSFNPSIWLEDKTPADMIDCRKCELYCQRSRVIWGEGNPDAPIIVLLDNPGAREDKEGNKYVCGTRQTLQQAAFDAGFGMKDLHITYILKCRPVQRYNKEAARGACMEHLLLQLELQKPKYAFCLGNTAVQWFFDNKEAEVKNLRGVWHYTRGLPTLTAYHPLAVRRRPNLYNQFLQDWKLQAERYFTEIRNSILQK